MINASESRHQCLHFAMENADYAAARDNKEYFIALIKRQGTDCLPIPLIDAPWFEYNSDRKLSEFTSMLLELLFQNDICRQRHSQCNNCFKLTNQMKARSDAIVTNLLEEQDIDCTALEVNTVFDCLITWLDNYIPLAG